MQDRIASPAMSAGKAQRLRGAGPVRRVKRLLRVLHGIRRALPSRTGAARARAGTRTPFRASRIVPVVFPLIGLIIFAGAPSAHAQAGVPSPASTGATLTLTPASGYRGGNFIAAGTGFDCGSFADKAIVRWDKEPPVTLTVQTDGSFSTTFTVPENAAFGMHTVTASCFGAEFADITADFEVLQPPSARPTLTLTPASGHPGDNVTAQGSGFNCVQYYDTAVVQWDGTELASTAVQPDGSFSKDFTVPADAAADTHTVTAQCSGTGSAAATADFTVLPPPTAGPVLTLNPESGHPGDSVTAQGSGFDCTNPVVQWNDGTTLASPTAQTDGSFSANFTVPTAAAAAAPGKHTVTAQCSGTGSPATADFTVLSATSAGPRVTLSTASGIPGTRVTATGSGFDCAAGATGRRGPVEVLWDDADLAATANADDSGGFSTGFNVPESAEGAHKVTARCADGAAGQAAVTTFTVRSVSNAPALNLTPDSGGAKTTVAVNGQRYPRACATFAMRLDGEVLPLRAHAVSADAATGTVAVTSEFDVPGSARAGTRTASLECTAQDGKLLASATAAFTVAAAGSPLLPGVLALVALLIVAAVLALLHARRVRGQRAWVREHVKVRSQEHATDISVEEPGTDRSHAVRLTAHLDAGNQDATEDATEVAP